MGCIIITPLEKLCFAVKYYFGSSWIVLTMILRILERNAWKLEHNTEELQEILMQGIVLEHDYLSPIPRTRNGLAQQD